MAGPRVVDVVDVEADVADVDADPVDVEANVADVEAGLSHPQISGVFQLPSARKRKYQTADGHGDLEVQECLCVRGCRLKEWLALPIIREGGIAYTRVSAKEQWLCELNAGRVRTGEWHSAIS